MRVPKRSKLLTASVTAKITSDDEQLFKSHAETSGLTLSEWTRQKLLQACEVAPDIRLLLAELSALRALFLTVHFDMLKGAEITEQRLKQMVEKFEKDKFSMADKRIHNYRAQNLASIEKKDSGDVD